MLYYSYLTYFYSKLVEEPLWSNHRKRVLVWKRASCSWHGNWEEQTIITTLEKRLKSVFVLDTESVTLCYGQEKCCWKLDKKNEFSFFFIRRSTLLSVNSLGLLDYEIVAFWIYWYISVLGIKDLCSQYNSWLVLLNRCKHKQILIKNFNNALFNLLVSCSITLHSGPTTCFLLPRVIYTCLQMININCKWILRK